MKTMKTKIEKAPKGMPTPLNLGVLSETFAAGREVPNGFIRPTSAESLRRCFKFGLLEVVGGRSGSLRLTELGANALCGYAMEFPMFASRDGLPTYDF